MLENLKKKLKEFSLANLFNRKAKAPKVEVPKEIVEDKNVQKAVVKHIGRRGRRRLVAAFTLAGAVSTGLQYAPGLVSKDLDTYMADKGYSGDYSQHFHTGDIRVYDRFNPLYPFHLAGREVGTIWHEGLKDSHATAVPLAIATPFVYTGAMIKGFLDMVPGSKLDAYSMANNDAPKDRVNFIRPPGEFSLQQFLKDFSGIKSEMKFQNSHEDLKDALFLFVMLHEARHGDQEKRAYITANESDADLYAFKVMQARGFSPELLAETATIVTHARSINSAIGGDASHASTFSMMRGKVRIFDAHQDAAAFDRLHSMLREADALNDAAFSPEMPTGNRYYHIARAMHERGMLDKDPAMKNAAAVFINAVVYFNQASGGTVIDQKYDMGKIDFSYLTKEYQPVPDKLKVQAPNAPRS